MSRLIDLIRLLPKDKLFRFLTRFWPRPSAWHRVPLIGALLAWRDRRSPLVRHILSNLVVGLGIAIVLWNLHGLSELRRIEDTGIDWMMRMQWGTPATRPGDPFVLLDIDESTYRHWGEPFHIPRDRLLNLIDYAAQAGAALLVVDIDLSQRGHDPAADANLQEYLANYATPGRPPLILARVFRESLDLGTMPFRSERRSFLEEDERIAQSPLIHWGSPLFNLDQDRILRRWRLWEPVCTDGQPSIVPSIQLLAVALLQSRGKDPESVGRDIRQALAPLSPERCDPVQPRADATHAHDSAAIRIVGLTLRTEPDAVAQRILYTQPWRLQPGQARLQIPGRDGVEIPALSIRSALPIGNHPMDPSWLAGRVVVIGTSFAESRDRFITPLGEMPGALVLINAIHSLYQYGELTAPPLYVKLLVEAVLIVVMSLAFAMFNSFWGHAVSGTFIIMALLPFSFFVFRYGVWLDFGIPLLAVQLHKMVSEFEGSHHRRGAAQHAPKLATSNASPSPTVPAASLESSQASTSDPLATAPSNLDEPTCELRGEAHYEPQPSMEPDAVGLGDDAATIIARGDLDQGLSGSARGLPAGTERPAAAGPVLSDPANR